MNKISTNIVIILTLAILFLSCTKKCKNINDFLSNKPMFENAKMVTYGQLDCDLFLVTVEYFNGTKRKIFMTFNHRIISEQ